MNLEEFTYCIISRRSTGRWWRRRRRGSPWRRRWRRCRFRRRRRRRRSGGPRRRRRRRSCCRSGRGCASSGTIVLLIIGHVRCKSTVLGVWVLVRVCCIIRCILIHLIPVHSCCVCCLGVSCSTGRRIRRVGSLRSVVVAVTAIAITVAAITITPVAITGTAVAVAIAAVSPLGRSLLERHIIVSYRAQEALAQFFRFSYALWSWASNVEEHGLIALLSGLRLEKSGTAALDLNLAPSLCLNVLDIVAASPNNLGPQIEPVNRFKVNGKLLFRPFTLEVCQRMGPSRLGKTPTLPYSSRSTLSCSRPRRNLRSSTSTGRSCCIISLICLTARSRPSLEVLVTRRYSGGFWTG